MSVRMLSSLSTVGTKSWCSVVPATRLPAGSLPGRRMISGTYSVFSYMPWWSYQHSCSYRVSPWSPLIAIRVLSPKPQLFDAGEDALDAGVHIGDGTVVLGIDVVAVAHSGRHPIGKEVAEGLEAEHRLHALVFGIEFIAAVKHPLKGGRRQIGGRADPCGARRERRASSSAPAAPTRGWRLG